VRNTIIPETEKPLVHCSFRALDIIPRDISGETTGAPICQEGISRFPYGLNPRFRFYTRRRVNRE